MFGFKSFGLRPVKSGKLRVNRECVDDVFASDLDDVTDWSGHTRSPEAMIDQIDETLDLLAIALQESLETRSMQSPELMRKARVLQWELAGH